MGAGEGLLDTFLRHDRQDFMTNGSTDLGDQELEITWLGFLTLTSLFLFCENVCIDKSD